MSDVSQDGTKLFSGGADNVGKMCDVATGAVSVFGKHEKVGFSSSFILFYFIFFDSGFVYIAIFLSIPFYLLNTQPIRCLRIFDTIVCTGGWDKRVNVSFSVF